MAHLEELALSHSKHIPGMTIIPYSSVTNKQAAYMSARTDCMGAKIIIMLSVHGFDNTDMHVEL